VIRPLHEGVARVLDLSCVPDHLFRETWSPQALLAEFPHRLTSVQDFIRERVAEWRHAQHRSTR
jgi:hypothetical protein